MVLFYFVILNSLFSDFIRYLKDNINESITCSNKAGTQKATTKTNEPKKMEKVETNQK